MNYGLKELPKDDRDFNFGSVFGAKLLLPTNDFKLGDLKVKDQGDSDLCTAFSVTSASELQENIELSPEYQFAKIKQLEGGIDTYGADLRTACKSLLEKEFGSLDVKLAPYSLNTKSRDFIADYENWDERYDSLAKKHAKKTFFAVSGGYDLFDNIRASLGQNYAIITGCIWRYSWNSIKTGIIPTKYENNGAPHAFLFVGQKNIEVYKDTYEPHLVAHLSNGRGYGDNGLFYFPREVVNKECRFGNYCLVDMEKEHAEHLIKNNWSSKLLWLTKIICFLKKVFRL